MVVIGYIPAGGEFQHLSFIQISVRMILDIFHARIGITEFSTADKLLQFYAFSLIPFFINQHTEAIFKG